MTRTDQNRKGKGRGSAGPRKGGRGNGPVGGQQFPGYQGGYQTDMFAPQGHMGNMGYNGGFQGGYNGQSNFDYGSANGMFYQPQGQQIIVNGRMVNPNMNMKMPMNGGGQNWQHNQHQGKGKQNQRQQQQQRQQKPKQPGPEAGASKYGPVVPKLRELEAKGPKVPDQIARKFFTLKLTGTDLEKTKSAHSVLREYIQAGNTNEGFVRIAWMKLTVGYLTNKDWQGLSEVFAETHEACTKEVILPIVKILFLDNRALKKMDPQAICLVVQCLVNAGPVRYELSDLLGIRDGVASLKKNKGKDFYAQATAQTGCWVEQLERMIPVVTAATLKQVEGEDVSAAEKEKVIREVSANLVRVQDLAVLDMFHNIIKAQEVTPIEVYENMFLAYSAILKDGKKNQEVETTCHSILEKLSGSGVPMGKPTVNTLLAMGLKSTRGASKWLMYIKHLPEVQQKLAKHRRNPKACLRAYDWDGLRMSLHSEDEFKKIKVSMAECMSNLVEEKDTENIQDLVGIMMDTRPACKSCIAYGYMLKILIALTQWREEDMVRKMAQAILELIDERDFSCPEAITYFKNVALGLVLEETAIRKRQVDPDDLVTQASLGLLIRDAEFEVLPGKTEDAPLVKFSSLPPRLKAGELVTVSAPGDSRYASKADMWSCKILQQRECLTALMMDDKAAFKRWQRSSFAGTAPMLNRCENNSDLEGLMRSLMEIVSNTKGLAKVLLPGAKVADVPEAGVLHDTQMIHARMTRMRSNLNCNESQYEAVVTAASRGLTLIQGPPGTGKTTVAAELCKLMVGMGKRVVVAAIKNIALDNILMHCLQAGIHGVLRIGQPQEEQLRHIAIDKTEPNLFARVRHSSVIAITSTALYGIKDLLKKVHIDMVIMDEVSQCTEPLALPGFILRPEHMVLVGDQNQLPPTIHSEEAKEKGLIRSVYHHLMEAGCEPCLLNVQYRMHPAIAEFPLRQFYQSRILNGISHADRPLPRTSFPWPRPDFPVAVLATRGSTESQDALNSFYNPFEVEVVYRTVELLLTNSELTPQDIAIISPYQGQSYHLHQRLQYILPGGVRTIDSFQGRHTKVVIVSMVRSNSGAKTGFTNNWNRLNVMMTRAQYGFIVVADPDTMKGNPVFRDYLYWANGNGVVAPYDMLIGPVQEPTPGSLGQPRQRRPRLPRNTDDLDEASSRGDPASPLTPMTPYSPFVISTKNLHQGLQGQTNFPSSPMLASSPSGSPLIGNGKGGRGFESKRKGSVGNGDAMNVDSLGKGRKGGKKAGLNIMNPSMGNMNMNLANNGGYNMNQMAAMNNAIATGSPLNPNMSPAMGPMNGVQFMNAMNTIQMGAPGSPLSTMSPAGVATPMSASVSTPLSPMTAASPFNVVNTMTGAQWNNNSPADHADIKRHRDSGSDEEARKQAKIPDSPGFQAMTNLNAQVPMWMPTRDMVRS